METTEMRQENEKILEKWRSLGFLSGLKKGSTNEWRCAKSFNDIAEYLLKGDNDALGPIAVRSFPFIRKVLCTGKNRLYRLIKPEELVEFFNTATIKDCASLIDYSTDKENEILLLRVLNYDKIKDDTLLEFFSHMDNKVDEPYRVLSILFFGAGVPFDIEAKVLLLASELFVKKSLDKK